MKKIPAIGFLCLLIIGCGGGSAGTVSAQSAQNPFRVITPGTPIFEVKRDYYQVTVRAGTLTVYTMGGSDTTIRVYDSSAQRLAEDDDSGTDYNARISITVPDGTYYILVGYAGSDETPYILSVEAPR